jgi:hypothetical protein
MAQDLRDVGRLETARRQFYVSNHVTEDVMHMVISLSVTSAKKAFTHCAISF